MIRSGGPVPGSPERRMHGAAHAWPVALDATGVRSEGMRS